MELHFPNSIRLQNSTPNVSSSLLPQTIFHFFATTISFSPFEPCEAGMQKYYFLVRIKEKSKIQFRMEKQNGWCLFVHFLALLDVFPCCWNLPSGSSSITILCVLVAELPSQFQSCDSLSQSCVRTLRKNQLLVKTFCFLPVFLTCCSKMTI